LSSRSVLPPSRSARSVSTLDLETRIEFRFLVVLPLTLKSTAVIAVLHGISYGLALDIAVACDIRICAATTRFAVKEVDIGIAADIGSLTRLPHANIPMSFIKDVALTARDFTAEEALRVGLVSDVCGTKAETLVKALDIAAVIATKSPVAVVGTKELLNYSRDHTVVDGLNYTAVWNAAYLQTRDVKDALAAALEKRRVKFSKL